MLASSGRDYFSLTFLLSSDPRVRWNTETPYGVSLFRSRQFSLTFCYPTTRESDGMQRHHTVICIFRSRLFSLTFCYLVTRVSSGIRRHLTVIRSFFIPRPQLQWHAETIVVICTLSGDVNVFRSRLFSLTFCYLVTRVSSGIRRHLTVIRSFVIPRPQVQRHAETNVVICTLFGDVSFFWSRLFSLTFCYLSYPNFIRGPSVVGMRPSFDHFEVLGTHL